MVCPTPQSSATAAAAAAVSGTDLPSKFTIDETNTADKFLTALDDDKLPPTTSATLANCTDLHILTYLPNMQSVPSMMVLTEMLRLSDVKLSLTVLRLIRLSERNSTVMMAAEAAADAVSIGGGDNDDNNNDDGDNEDDGSGGGGGSGGAVSEDVVVQVFKAFATLCGIKWVRALLAVAAIEEFPEQIVKAALTTTTINGRRRQRQQRQQRPPPACNLVILPWRDGAADGEEHGAVDEGLRNGLIDRVHRLAPCSVAVFIDRGFGMLSEKSSGTRAIPHLVQVSVHDDVAVEMNSTTAEYSAVTSTRMDVIGDGGAEVVVDPFAPQRILFPFFGGQDDREALSLIVLLCKSNVTLTVLRIRLSAVSISYATDVGAKATTTTGNDTISSPQTSSNDSRESNQDDRLLQFTLNKLRAMGCPVRFIEISTASPAAKLQEIAAEGAASRSMDLVVLGNKVYQQVPEIAHWVDKDMVASVMTVLGHVEKSITLI